MSSGLEQNEAADSAVDEADRIDENQLVLDLHEFVFLFGFDLSECEITTCYRFDEKLAS